MATMAADKGIYSVPAPSEFACIREQNQIQNGNG